VTVTCTTNTYHIKGTIAGLTGTGLVLQDNGADNLSITAGATAFQFAGQIQSGQAYSVTVHVQPNSPAQYCVVTNGSGTVSAADVTNVAIGCRNQGVYAFVADSMASTVSAFTITSNTGNLTYQTSAATVTAAGSPQGIAAVTLPNSAGTYIYTADFGTAAVTEFSLNTATNPVTVTAVDEFTTGTAPVANGPGSTPTAVAVDPTGLFLLVADSQNAALDNSTTTPGQLLVFSIDQTTGELTPADAGVAAPTDSVPGNYTSDVAMTVNPADTPFVFATNQFRPLLGLAGFAFNTPPILGNLTPLSTWQVPTGNAPVWVTVDPFDRFVYVSNMADGTITGYGLNKVSGALTPLNSGTAFSAGFTAGANPGAMAIDPTGRFMYVTDTANAQLVLLAIDPTTGVLSPVTGSGSPYTTDAGAAAPFAVSIDPSGHFVYVGNTALGTISMYTADPITGALTTVGAGTPLTYPGATGANAITIQ
jgi:6-phosphogluconolactonase (cycloisomerase 2 family)